MKLPDKRTLARLGRKATGTGGGGWLALVVIVVLVAFWSNWMDLRSDLWAAKARIDELESFLEWECQCQSTPP